MLKNNYAFPYPTLLTKPLHYKKSTLAFQVLIEVESDQLRMTYRLNVKSDFVHYLLDEGICSAYLIVDSEYSMYREVIKVEKFDENVLSIFNIQDIKDKLTITPVISLNTDFSNFKSDEFKNSDLEYTTKKYDIIGFVEPYEFYLDNLNSIFSSLANIFTIRNSKSSSKNLDYKLDDELITIFVHDAKTYERIQEINLSGDFSNTMYQILVLPALVDAIMNLKNPQYEDYRWSRLIQNRVLNYRKTFNINYKQAYELAQNILENPLSKSIKELHSVGDNNE